MHYYQWYAMVNHCLALVVSIHKITKENWQGKKNVEKERERERVREFIKGKNLVLQMYLNKRIGNVCKC